MPSVSRPPLIAWTVPAIRASIAGCRFITFETHDPIPIRRVTAAAAASVVHCSRTGTVGSPLPMT